MFIRQCYRQKNGKRHGYWTLVESYRTARGPRQLIVSYLGQVDESLRHGVSQPSDLQAILLQRLDLKLPKILPLTGKFLK